ncbi:hypothetical protein HK405_015107, partial [Cladochytrium tenue]
MWVTAAHKIAVAVAHDNSTGSVVAVSADMTMSTINEKLWQVSTDLDYDTFIVAIEVSSGHLLGASDQSLSTIDLTHTRILNFHEFPNNPFLADFSSYINSTFGTKLPAGATGNETLAGQQMALLAAALRSGGSVSRATRPAPWGSNFMMRADLVDGIPWETTAWLTVQYLNVDDTAASIERTDYAVRAIVLSIVAAAVLIGVAFALAVGRQIRRVVAHIRTLKDLRFEEVMQEAERARGNGAAARAPLPLPRTWTVSNGSLSSTASTAVLANGGNGANGGGGARTRFLLPEVGELLDRFFDMVLRFGEQIRANRNILLVGNNNTAAAVPAT